MTNLVVPITAIGAPDPSEAQLRGDALAKRRIDTRPCSVNRECSLKFNDLGENFHARKRGGNATRVPMESLEILTEMFVKSDSYIQNAV